LAITLIKKPPQYSGGFGVIVSPQKQDLLKRNIFILIYIDLLSAFFYKDKVAERKNTILYPK
jgi:hypothetical protein